MLGACQLTYLDNDLNKPTLMGILSQKIKRMAELWKKIRIFWYIIFYMDEQAWKLL